MVWKSEPPKKVLSHCKRTEQFDPDQDHLFSSKKISAVWFGPWSGGRFTPINLVRNKLKSLKVWTKRGMCERALKSVTCKPIHVNHFATMLPMICRDGEQRASTSKWFRNYPMRVFICERFVPVSIKIYIKKAVFVVVCSLTVACKLTFQFTKVALATTWH